jgi:hypothetical protein
MTVTDDLTTRAREIAAVVATAKYPLSATDLIRAMKMPRAIIARELEALRIDGRISREYPIRGRYWVYRATSAEQRAEILTSRAARNTIHEALAGLDPCTTEYDVADAAQKIRAAGPLLARLLRASPAVREAVATILAEGADR